VSKKKAKKYLVDTSVVPAALRKSTAEHNDYFAAEVAQGTLAASVYVRMEFIRLWVCSTIRVAVTISSRQKAGRWPCGTIRVRRSCEL
jgi:hypothetical protein